MMGGLQAGKTEPWPAQPFPPEPSHDLVNNRKNLCQQGGQEAGEGRSTEHGRAIVSDREDEHISWRGGRLARSDLGWW